MKTFTFISDSGHGWLAVPKALVRTLGVGYRISRYSYEKDGVAYLEEDCDAPLVIKALQDSGVAFDIREEYVDGESPVRGFARFHSLI